MNATVMISYAYCHQQFETKMKSLATFILAPKMLSHGAVSETTTETITAPSRSRIF